MIADENTKQDGGGWQPAAEWHTRTWYLKNYFADPAEHDLPYHEYAGVRWWREEDVLPFRNAEKVSEAQRSELVKQRLEREKQSAVRRRARRRKAQLEAEREGLSEEELDEVFEAKFGSKRFDLPPKGWCYLTTASKEFNLTLDQLREGVRNGVLQCRRVENPHRPNGPKSTIVERKEVADRLTELQALPKKAPEKSQSVSESHPREVSLRKLRLPKIGKAKANCDFRRQSNNFIPRSSAGSIRPSAGQRQGGGGLSC